MQIVSVAANTLAMASITSSKRLVMLLRAAGFVWSRAAGPVVLRGLSVRGARPSNGKFEVFGVARQ
jgi:hypothetical protein